MRFESRPPTPQADTLTTMLRGGVPLQWLAAQDTATALGEVKVSESLGGCSQYAKCKSLESGCQEFIGSACGNSEGLGTECAAEDTCETFGGMHGSVTGHVTSRGKPGVGGGPDREKWKRR